MEKILKFSGYTLVIVFNLHLKAEQHPVYKIWGQGTRSTAQRTIEKS